MKQHVLEKLAATNPESEIWWDSSPLIFQSWKDETLAKDPDPANSGWREQTVRLFDLQTIDAEGKMGFRGVTTNPPLCLQASKLDPPTAVQVATSEYFETEDAFTLWADQCCTRNSGDWEFATVLFKSWEKWAKSAGEQPGSQKRFSAACACARPCSMCAKVRMRPAASLMRFASSPARQLNA